MKHILPTLTKVIHSENLVEDEVDLMGLLDFVRYFCQNIQNKSLLLSKSEFEEIQQINSEQVIKANINPLNYIGLQDTEQGFLSRLISRSNNVPISATVFWEEFLQLLEDMFIHYRCDQIFFSKRLSLEAIAKFLIKNPNSSMNSFVTKLIRKNVHVLRDFVTALNREAGFFDALMIACRTGLGEDLLHQLVTYYAIYSVDRSLQIQILKHLKKLTLLWEGVLNT